MKNLNKNEHGFGAVEIILVLVIVALLGVVGWFVYDRNHNKTTPSSTTTTTPVVTTPAKPVQDYLVVKEWGTKIPLNDNVKGLYLDSNTGFRTTALEKLSGGCKTNSVAVLRGLATDHVPAEVGQGDTFLKTYTDIRSQDYSTVTTRSIALYIGKYYYVPPAFAGASCASTSSQSQTESTILVNIAKAVRQMVAE